MSVCELGELVSQMMTVSCIQGAPTPQENMPRNYATKIATGYTVC